MLSGPLQPFGWWSARLGWQGDGRWLNLQCRHRNHIIGAVNMIKIVFCLRRNPGQTQEAFQEYWLNRHAPLVRERARRLGIRRYVQSHTISDPRLSGLGADRGFTGEAFDGVAELWFDSAAVLYPRADAPHASIQAARELIADEAQFIDLANSPIFVVEEHEILPAS